jgi:hypothetical protein
MHILILIRQKFHWKDVVIHVNHASHALFKLQIWVLKSGDLKIVCTLCEHGTKANIGGRKEANNRHAVNMNFLQSYWTSDGLSLYSKRKTYPNQHLERLVKIQKTTCNVTAWRQYTIAWSDGCHSQPVLFCKDNGYQIDVCQQEQCGTVWNQQDWSQGG